MFYYKIYIVYRDFITTLVLNYTIIQNFTFSRAFISHIHSATVLCEMYMYCIESSVKSVLQESQGLTTNTFVVLLLAMIYLHMLIFRLIVTMVAEFAH